MTLTLILIFSPGRRNSYTPPLVLWMATWKIQSLDF
jgi:hypothetical protein